MPVPCSSITLPPLILHPFADRGAAEKIRAAIRSTTVLAEAGPLASADEELVRRLVECRYSEFRMLCFLGKDVARWMEQCMDFVARSGEFSHRRIRPQSFASLLTEDPPAGVADKLRGWGVADYRSIFSRAIGLESVFPHAPDPGVVSEQFLRSYHHYADALFLCRQQIEEFDVISSREFHFELYASGEYSRILEQQWSAEAADKG